MHRLIVEFHGFRSLAEKTFVFKELAIVNVSDCTFTVYHFKPPYPQSRLSNKDLKSAYWLSNFYHRLSWNDGVLDYSLDTIIGLILRVRSSSSNERLVLYTKGVEKKRYLDDLLFNHENVLVVDVSDIADYNTSSNKVTCSLKEHSHSKSHKCSLKTALEYFDWLYNDTLVFIVYSVNKKIV
jgi:hypothetical protein